jgi:hypothetical protein
MQGGCYIITSRILIVDLLDSKVDAQSIFGLLVYNAHRYASDVFQFMYGIGNSIVLTCRVCGCDGE